MKIQFHKYQGTGNDFIMIDDINRTFPANDKSLIASLCVRKFGIGSDGILLLQSSEDADFNVDFINPDGSRSFCGNGSRCAVLFAKDLGIIENECSFTAIDGKHEAKIMGNQIELKMSDANPVEEMEDDFYLDTGSPHHVVFVEDVAHQDVYKVGRSIRYNDHYKQKGVNVNLVERKEDHIVVRTYERGVEDETLSCGTGVTAAALASMQNQSGDHVLKVKTLGGELSVKMSVDKKGFTEIWLCGPAKKVFEGTLKI